jgi:hypothetical protein
MLRATSRPDAERFLEFVRSSDFSEPGFQSRPAIQQLPSRHAGNLPWLLEATAEPTGFNILARLFLFGLSQPVHSVLAAMPRPVFDFLLETGLAAAEDDRIVPLTMLTPTEGWLIAADPVYRMQPEAAPDIILWPNQSTRVLQHFALREPCGSTLDYGAGCGVVAILASPFSRQVIATDLNPRTEEFVRFNCWLNAVSNVECRIGDSFAPLAGAKFDRILANPPFFVVPSSGVLYCENPLELDGFCRQVTRQAAEHLNEGGFLQMTCEWAQVDGEPWQERLAGWVDSTGCDAWVLRTYASDAAAYAHERCCNQYADMPEAASARYRSCVDYYRARRVKEIHGGLLVLHRRSGANWARFEEGRLASGRPFSNLVKEVFATQDALHGHPDDDALAALRPHLSPDAAIEQQLRLEGGRWVATSCKLGLSHAIPSSLAIEQQIADFLVLCDGTRTLAELARELGAAVNAPPEVVRQQCCAVVRRLAERRLLSFAESAEAAQNHG